MQTFKQSFKTYKIIEVITGLYGVILILLALNSFFQYFLYGDGGGDGAGFYIPTAEMMASGENIFGQPGDVYTPLGLMFMSLLYNCLSGFVEGSLYIHYSTLYLVNFISVGLIAYILKKLHVSKLIILVSIGVYLHLYLSYHGAQIFLEPFVVMFSLGSYAFYLSCEKLSFKNTMVLGMIACLCLMSKQYGLVLLPLYLLMLFLDDKSTNQKRFKYLWIVMILCSFICLRYNVFVLPCIIVFPILTALLVFWEYGSFNNLIEKRKLVLGFLSGYLSCFFVFLIFLGQSPMGFFEHYFFDQSDYAQWGRVSSNKIYGMMRQYHFIFLVMGIGFFLLYQQSVNFKKVVLMGAAFVPCLAVRQYDDYFLMILPFIALNLALALEACKQKHQSLFLISIVFIALLHPRLTQSRWHDVNRDQKVSNFRYGKELRSILNDRSKALIIGDAVLYYFSKTTPTMVEKYGYVYLDQLNKNELEEKISKTEVLMLDKAHRTYQLLFPDKKAQDDLNSRLMREFKFVEQTTQGMEVWYRKG